MTPEAQRADAARAAARARRAAAAPIPSTDRSLYDRCITRGLPGSMMPAIYGNSYDIVQAPGFVGDPLRDDPRDARHSARRPPARRRRDPAVTWATRAATGKATRWSSRRRTSGTRASIARRNPDTLQLDRTLHARRRRTRIEWTVTVDDPTTWTRPWTFAMPLTMNDEERIMEYACHEGNHAMANILSAGAGRGRGRPEGPEGRRRVAVPTAAEGER